MECVLSSRNYCKKVLLAWWDIQCTFQTIYNLHRRRDYFFSFIEIQHFCKGKKSICRQRLSIPRTFIAAEIKLTNEINAGKFIFPKLTKIFILFEYIKYQMNLTYVALKKHSLMKAGTALWLAMPRVQDTLL